MPYPTLRSAQCALFLLLAADAAGAACHVTTAGTAANDGSAWTQPMDLRTALAAPACTEIWVAEGVYRPGAAGDRAASFRVRQGTAVYGGFAGDETVRDARDWLAHPSVLSGDLGGDDPVDAHGVLAHGDDIVGENAFYVVQMWNVATGSGTLLDGFTLTAGDSTDVAPPNGGGLYCNGFAGVCSPDLRNLRFAGNHAVRGGGLAVSTDSGGRSSIALERVRFDGNTAGTGGGMWLQGRNGSLFATLRDVVFDGNSATGEGGAVKISGHTDAQFHAVTFHGNTAIEGGALGADAVYGNVTVQANNVTFDGNHARRGGALRTEAVNVNGVAMVFDNATFTDNTATSVGTVLSSIGPLTGLEFRNTAIWGNGEPDDVQDWVMYAEIVPAYHHVVTQFDCAGCTNAVTADPLFGPLGQHGGFVPTRVPAAAGAGVDAGDDAICAGADVAGVDARGVARPQGAACDIGAVERSAADRVELFADGFEAPP